MFTLTLCTYVNSDLFPFSSTITMPHPRKHWRRTKGRGQTPTGSMDLPIVNESARRTLHRPLTGNSNFYMRGGYAGIPGNTLEEAKQWVLKHGKPARKGFWGKLLDIGETTGRAIGSQIKQHGLLSKAAGIAEAVTGGLPIASTVIGALGGGKRRKGKYKRGGFSVARTMPYVRPPWKDFPPYDQMPAPHSNDGALFKRPVLAQTGGAMVMGYNAEIGKFHPMSHSTAVALRTHIL